MNKDVVDTYYVFETFTTIIYIVFSSSVTMLNTQRLLVMLPVYIGLLINPLFCSANVFHVI